LPAFLAPFAAAFHHVAAAVHWMIDVVAAAPRALRLVDVLSRI